MDLDIQRLGLASPMEKRVAVWVAVPPKDRAPCPIAIVQRVPRSKTMTKLTFSRLDQYLWITSLISDANLSCKPNQWQTAEAAETHDIDRWRIGLNTNWQIPITRDITAEFPHTKMAASCQFSRASNMLAKISEFPQAIWGKGPHGFGAQGFKVLVPTSSALRLLSNLKGPLNSFTPFFSLSTTWGRRIGGQGN